MAGQMIKIITPKPRLSVRTVEEITYTDAEKRRVDEQPNNAQPASFRRVIQEGRDGTREVMAHLTRINGVEQERREITSRTLLPAEPQIVEVGTQ
jgi:uncharacterized protein YabE (DUF348 family)